MIGLRRWSTIVLVSLLIACGRPAPAPENAGAAVVATAAGEKLAGKTLQHWLATEAAAPDRAAATVLISAWIDQSLFATALERGPSIRDSITVDSAIAWDSRMGAARGFRAAMNAKLPAVSDAQADSLADLDRVRVFQDLALNIPPGADSATIAAIASRARLLLKRAEGGADFAGLVAEASQDSISRRHGGFLPPVTREDLPPGIAAPLWALHAGDISQLLANASTVHFFRRASRLESRPYLKAWLGPSLALLADRKFADSLFRARGLIISSDAAARVRAIAREPVVVVDTAPLATWTGGSLSPAEVRRGLLMLYAAQRAFINNASDSVALKSVRDLAETAILLSVAGVGDSVPSVARAALGPQYRRALDSVAADLHRYGNALPPGAAAAALLDTVVVKRGRLRPLPGALAALLRARYPVILDTMVIDRLVSEASITWRQTHRADSTAVASPNAFGAPAPRTP